MARKGILIGLLVAVLASAAWAYEPYFSDAAGNKLGMVWEGQQIYIAIKDPDKGACGIDQFQADLTVFDFKTGAYFIIEGAWFRELEGIGSGLYFWVQQRNSNSKIAIQVGARFDYTLIPEGQTHIMGRISPIPPVGGDNGALNYTNGWVEGAWEYVDEDFSDGATLVDTGSFPQRRLTARVDFAGLNAGNDVLPASEEPGIEGRFENNDTLILIARDRTDERNINQDQIKIHDTVAKLTVVPSRLDYGCGPSCSNIVITIEDKDENLNCNEVEYVPFFVIINPGSWNPLQSAPVTNFCNLLMWGAHDDEGGLYAEPIRWYNIYEPERWINYLNAAWWNPAWWNDGLDQDNGFLRTVFFAAETSVDSGVFTFDFGNLEDFQRAIGLADGSRLPPGTTIAFYYIDPNDYDDMDLATVQVGNRPLSQTFITDANGIPVNEVRIGAGWGGLYIRVYDADANVQACCQDKVVVHICDPHNEDDSEYYVIDEISNDSGIFFSQSGIPLLPVWDAVAGYQLVFDDWRVQSFNEDTIFIRYNSVDYLQEHLNALGDGDANDDMFPPAIMDGMEHFGFEGVLPLATRNQYWDVSFAKVKVYDYQVYDGTTHHMRFLNGQYQPVTTIPVSGSLYLEVTDLDQNEHPAMRELIFGGWNKDAVAADDNTDANEDSMPIWGRGHDGVLNWEYDATDPFRPGDPVFWDTSISGIAETVKVFMFNPQRSTWERMDLRETAVGSGIFRSTTCVLVSAASLPTMPVEPGTPMGHLWSKPGDTIMAFYQDPSNHSDISVISIKVNEGGAGGITPPVVALSVAFDRANYNPEDPVTITVTDEQYAGANEITGAAKPLILKKADGTELASWTTIPAVAGDPGKFRVSYVLPADVTGTIIAVYTDPLTATRTAQAQATVAAPVLTGVSDVKPVPEVFSTSTTFTVYAQPTGAVASKVTIEIYDLTGRKVATLTGTNTATVSWNGGTLRNGAYIYVWTVEGGNPIQTWTGKGFVYIKR